MMEILRGSPALSAFRINKLLNSFRNAHLPVSDIYAEYVHFADVSSPLTEDEKTVFNVFLNTAPHWRSMNLPDVYCWSLHVPGRFPPGLLKRQTLLITVNWRKSSVWKEGWRSISRLRRFRDLSGLSCLLYYMTG